MSTLVSSSSPSSSTHKHNKIKRIVSTWQRFARNKKAIASLSDDLEQDHDRQHKLPNEGTFVVYVGKERRQYVLGEHYLQMPLFRSLLDKSKPNSTSVEQQDRDCELFVPCEVVMFEHLLWMLDSGNGNSIGAVDELVDFYAY